MNAIDLLVDSVGRVQENVHTAVNGLGQEQLGHRLDPEANSIAWLVWHLTRVQDDHVAEVAGHEQVWTAQGWVERFALPFGPRATGYGQGSAEIAALGAVSGELLTGYYDAVHASTVEYLRTLTDDDLDRVVDTRWDPPVTLGVRLVSVIDDDAQHAGQASFVRGILERRA